MANSDEFRQRIASIEARLEGMNDEFSERMNSFVDGLLALSEQTTNLSNRLDRLTDRVDRLAQTQQELTEVMVQFARNAEADRAVIRENQVEIRRIWEYLLSQSGNGRHGQS
jgi:predicted  nucleic acid-binding Zn-ribbon protein